MAPRRKVRQGDAQLAFDALSIEGGLLSPEWLAKVAQLEADHQAATDYRIPKGLNLRDDIGRYWRIAQAHWNELQAGIKANADRKALADRFVLALVREVLGFGAVTPTAPLHVGERSHPVGHRALEGRVPIVIAPAGSGLDTLAPEFGDLSRRRSAFGLAQEYLNAEEKAVWGIATDANTLRILRDNASLTRPAWIEADLARIFAEERYADFAALWLLAHETRFGASGHPASDCPLEVWRNAGREEGTKARDKLRDGVQYAVEELGVGFLRHPENQALRAALQGGKLTRDALFQQLLRLVYRLIFLLTAEERGVLHPPDAAASAKALYEQGYGLRRLRDRAVKRSAHDRFADLWEGLKIVLRGVARGEPRLALPALGGLFDADQCPELDAAKLENRALLAAVFKLSWLRQDNSLSRVNWRDMGPEELGSVYESLLELVPVVPEDGRGFSFATGDETKGNARKTTGSYYTPDSLVQVLLDSALEPVVQQTIAAHPDRPAEALLQLSIVDPACGSGHFLLAAARRLAAHVARLQADGTPSAAEYRHALRQVVSRCLFGVDLNPMAVELCRVSLWMEAVEPGRPLSFLDSHIQQGNALLGATPELMAKGVPTKAFEPIEGDDKKTASLLKKKNEAAAEGQRGLDSLWSKPTDAESAEVAKAVAALEAAPDASLEDVVGKEAQWDGLQRSFAFTHQKFIADAWCAAFVWPMPPTEPKKVAPVVAAAPTNDLWRQIRDGQGKPPAETVKTVAELASQYHFFHWHLAFPHVCERGGFDVVIGNPPWDRVTLEEKEWFAASRPDIATAPTATARAKLIERLAQEDPGLFEAFSRVRREVAGEKCFLKASGRYPLTSAGIINTFALFFECMREQVRPGGALGGLFPTGIATTDGTEALFRAVLDAGEVSQVLDFHNKAGLFPAVIGNVRFCAFTLRKRHTESMRVASQLSDPAEAALPGRTFSLTPEDVARVNPTTHHLPLFRTAKDAAIVAAMYRKCPALAQHQAPGFRFDFTRMLNMADDSDKFVRVAPEELAELPNTSLLPLKRGSSRLLPLYEAKLTSAYNHRASTFLGTDPSRRYGLKAGTVAVSDERLANPEFAALPRYWVDQAQLTFTSELPFLVAYRDAVSAIADSRCLEAVVLPYSAVGDTLRLVLPGGIDEAVVIAAAFNSHAVDYVFRQKSSSSHASQFILRQLPLPVRSDFDAAAPWDRSASVLAWIRRRVVELIFTAWDLKPFAQSVGVEEPPFRWDSNRRRMLQAELDAAFFILYGLEHSEVEFVLGTFEIERNVETQKWGDYTTGRTCLELYDAMAEAIRTGKPYQTRLDPPPADPRVAHPPGTEASRKRSRGN